MRQNNGGRVEPLEKNADYLIADHAKPQKAPANAFSWKWIDESITAGRLLDPADYLITKAKAKGEPSQPSTEDQPRERRTAFTEEDDRELIAFIREHAEKNEYLLGLKIYKELAAKVSGHEPPAPVPPSPGKPLITMPESSPHNPVLEG